MTPRPEFPTIDASFRRRARSWWLVALAAVVLLGFSTTVSYYVEGLWFGSLGYGDVFWSRIGIQATVFLVFGLATFAILQTAFSVVVPRRPGAHATFFVNGRPVQFSITPVLRLAGFVVAGFVAFTMANGMSAEWSTFAVWWHSGPAGAAETLDPILGRPVSFYLLVLPAWQLVMSWLTTVAVVIIAAAFVGLLVSGGLGRLGSGGGAPGIGGGFCAAWAGLLGMLALRAYVGRFERLLQDHAVFSGVTYTDAHVVLTGSLILSAALAVGAGLAAVGAFADRRFRFVAASAALPLVCAIGIGATSWYVGTFIVRPNQLVREQPYIAHNITFTRQAYGLDRIQRVDFPAAPGVAALDASHNQATLQNIRLWDWRALQDTLRQIQEIRTYYDFPDIDIDRYRINGQLRHVMLAARELSVGKLPAASRTWVNEKLIYTHGYGVTLNAVNGFTPEGMPDLLLRNMPVESMVPDLRVTRPEIYFGELTTTDVYVRTKQKEFNYPQGQSNELTSYEGKGGIVLGGLARRLLIAYDQGDLGKVPFSDDIGPESRLLMRRDVKSRVAALTPFIIFDQDPYIVIGADGRISWILDGFTTSDHYPYSRRTAFEEHSINYLRNSVKATVDAYDGTTTFYVFDSTDPIIAAYRRVFPSLFRDRAAMPADLQAHVRYPELLMSVQANVFGLYHMTDPSVLYNREDLWTVASQASQPSPSQPNGHTVYEPMEPNFVLMALPGSPTAEFIGILPFTPASRNNLIAWIAGRSDGGQYGTAVVYDFPKTRLVEGPLQIEARIDQDPQLSGQLTLWNQQGSRVRRGGLLVIPIGQGLLYAQPMYLQAERSPMPELRLVILALQDRLVYAPTFDAALAKLFETETPAATLRGTEARVAQPVPAPPGGQDLDALITEAGREMAEYQRLTAEGRLGEAGQMLEKLKRTLDELARRRR